VTAVGTVPWCQRARGPGTVVSGKGTGGAWHQDLRWGL
jgi:hypothetical protein